MLLYRHAAKGVKGIRGIKGMAFKGNSTIALRWLVSVNGKKGKGQCMTTCFYTANFFSINKLLIIAAA